MRREWIEIRTSPSDLRPSCRSPSMRREWIEILLCSDHHGLEQASPSMRREWIEIFSELSRNASATSLPPCGGSGLKCYNRQFSPTPLPSPSMRREWIEINSRIVKPRLSRLPPCGGSGLKCGMRNPLNSWDKVSLHAEGVD